MGGKREKTVRQNGETMKKGDARANEMRSALRSRISGGGQEGCNKRREESTKGRQGYEGAKLKGAQGAVEDTRWI